MVARGVGRHHNRQPADARAAKQPGDAALRWSSVEEDRGAVGMLHERGVALPDVEEADRELARCRRRAETGRGREPEQTDYGDDDADPNPPRSPPPGGCPLGESA